MAQIFVLTKSWLYPEDTVSGNPSVVTVSLPSSLELEWEEVPHFFPIATSDYCLFFLLEIPLAPGNACQEPTPLCSLF